MKIDVAEDPDEMAKVLVTDGGERAALAVVRSLGKAGHEVFVASHEHKPLAGASKYATEVVHLSDPLASQEKYADRLLSTIDRYGPDLLIPVTEASLLQVLPLRNLLEGLILPFPDADSFRRICDKRAVLQEARSVGIRIPGQWTLDGPGESIPGELTESDFPLVAKPTRSVVGTEDGRRQTGIIRLPSLGDLRTLSEKISPAVYPILLQEYVSGPGIGIFLLRADEGYLATFAHRRLREKPPAGGVSVYRESVQADPSLVEQSRALLERFHWRGVAMIEYKVDAATGAPYLMEINGRFWGSLQLAIDAGVDFPSLLVEAFLDERPNSVHEYRTGIRSRWLWGDVDHLLSRLRKSRRELHLPADAPGRFQAILDFLRISRNDRLEVLRLSDPMPFLRETTAWFGSL